MTLIIERLRSNHALFNAHHLRELTFIQERNKYKWAKYMETFLLMTKKRVESHYQETKAKLPEKELKRLYCRYKYIVSQGRIECPRAEKTVLAKKRPLKRI